MPLRLWGRSTGRQRGHRPWKAGITRSPAQGPVPATTCSPSSSTVRHAPSSASAIAATTCSACFSVSRTSGAKGPAADGSAVNAALHRGSSSAGRRWTVPRGPCVRTSERSSHSAARTSFRVTPAARTPIATSAADGTWAWAPSMAATTSSTTSATTFAGDLGPPAGELARNCRSSRRAEACRQLILKVVASTLGGKEVRSCPLRRRAPPERPRAGSTPPSTGSTLSIHPSIRATRRLHGVSASLSRTVHIRRGPDVSSRSGNSREQSCVDVTAQWRGLRGDARVKPAFAVGLARRGDSRTADRPSLKSPQNLCFLR